MYSSKLNHKIVHGIPPTADAKSIISVNCHFQILKYDNYVSIFYAVPVMNGNSIVHFNFTEFIKYAQNLNQYSLPSYSDENEFIDRLCKSMTLYKENKFKISLYAHCSTDFIDARDNFFYRVEEKMNVHYELMKPNVFHFSSLQKLETVSANIELKKLVKTDINSSLTAWFSEKDLNNSLSSFCNKKFYLLPEDFLVTLINTNLKTDLVNKINYNIHECMQIMHNCSCFKDRSFNMHIIDQHIYYCDFYFGNDAQINEAIKLIKNIYTHVNTPETQMMHLLKKIDLSKVDMKKLARVIDDLDKDDDYDTCDTDSDDELDPVISKTETKKNNVQDVVEDKITIK